MQLLSHIEEGRDPVYMQEGGNERRNVGKQDESESGKGKWGGQRKDEKAQMIEGEMKGVNGDGEMQRGINKKV